MKRNKSCVTKITLEWIWQPAHGHLFSTSLATLYLFRLGKAKLRAAVAIETKQDGQYCLRCGRGSGMNRLSLCLLGDLREFN